MAGEKDPSAQIDSILQQHWEANGVAPNPPASDETFLRRIYLDAVGRIPTYAESKAFLSSPAPDKRRKLIDQLLASE